MSRRRRALDGLADDLRDHIERETRDNIARGMTPEEARHAALRKFGNPTRIQEQTREVWIGVRLEQLAQDLRYSLRTLRLHPAFTLVAILTLALGIGMNTAIFSVVNSVLLRPVSYPNPERLVWVADYDPNLKRDSFSSLFFTDCRARNQSYTAMAAYGYEQAALEAPRQASQVIGVAVAGDFWKIVGGRPALGRFFGPEEQNTIVISWNLFERDFGGDPATVGKPVTLDGRAFTVTGVLPKDFRFQFPMWWMAGMPQPVEMYVPLTMPKPGGMVRLVNVVASLKPGTSIAKAQAELEVMVKQVLAASGLRPPPWGMKLHVEPLRDTLTVSSRPALLILLAAGAFVLLIAAVNIANLLLARATTRQREIAIRAAVGAGRARLIRQLLAESILLALLGGAAGLLLARWGVAVLIRMAPGAIPRLAETNIDVAVLTFTLLVSVITGVLFGAGPAFALWRTNLHDALKDATRASTGFVGLRLRRLLVGAELALAIVLLTGAGLMVKSFWRMSARPPGFSPQSVLMMKVRLAGGPYTARPARDAYMRSLLDRLQSTPGVQAAGISNWFLLISGALPNDASPSQTHVLRILTTSPGYLKALGMQLVKGRWLTDTDSANTILLNESMARLAYGARDPIGQEFPLRDEKATVVGIVKDLKYSQLDADPPPESYKPFPQLGIFSGVNIAVRVSGDVSAAGPAIEKQIFGIDATQPPYAVETLEQALSDSIAPRRFNLFLLGTFAAAALLLALVGIYGVIAYSVAERTREIGVRMALGAQRNQVVRMVVTEGMTVALVGIFIGITASSLLMRLMASLLYGVKPNDPSTFAAVSAALAVTALAACCIPAAKAAWVDPTVALRYE